MKGGLVINLAETGGNTLREWTVGPAMEVSMGPHNGIGGELCVGAAPGSDSGMIMGPTLDVSLGPPNSVE